MNDWRNERRTAVQWIREAAAAEEGGVAALARRVGMDPGHLRQWLRDPSRGLRPENIERIRRGLGIPTSALIHRHEPIGRVIRRELAA